MNPDDKVVLLISNSSMKSPWIETTVNRALEREAQTHHPMLIPCQLNTSVMEAEPDWFVRLRNTHHILDFTQWETKEIFDDHVVELLTNLLGND